MPVDWEQPFLDAYRVHANVTAASQVAGISRSTVYKRRDRSKGFAAAMHEAEGEALDAIELAVHRAALEGDMQTARWLLARRRPEKWGDRSKVEMSGPDGGPIPVESTVHTPDPETWAEILRIRESIGDTAPLGQYASDETTLERATNGHSF